MGVREGVREEVGYSYAPISKHVLLNKKYNHDCCLLSHSLHIRSHWVRHICKTFQTCSFIIHDVRPSVHPSPASVRLLNFRISSSVSLFRVDINSFFSTVSWLPEANDGQNRQTNRHSQPNNTIKQNTRATATIITTSHLFTTILI